MTFGYRAVASMQGKPIALERTDLLDAAAQSTPAQTRQAEQAGLAA